MAVAEDSQRVSMVPTMAAEVAANKLAGPKEPGLGFYEEDAGCMYPPARSYSRKKNGENQRR